MFALAVRRGHNRPVRSRRRTLPSSWRRSLAFAGVPLAAAAALSAALLAASVARADPAVAEDEVGRARESLAEALQELQSKQDDASESKFTIEDLRRMQEQIARARAALTERLRELRNEQDDGLTTGRDPVPRDLLLAHPLASVPSTTPGDRNPWQMARLLDPRPFGPVAGLSRSPSVARAEPPLKEPPKLVDLPPPPAAPAPVILPPVREAPQSAALPSELPILAPTPPSRRNLEAAIEPKPSARDAADDDDEATRRRKAARGEAPGGPARKAPDATANRPHRPTRQAEDPRPRRETSDSDRPARSARRPRKDIAATASTRPRARAPEVAYSRRAAPSLSPRTAGARRTPGVIDLPESLRPLLPPAGSPL